MLDKDLGNRSLEAWRLRSLANLSANNPSTFHPFNPSTKPPLLSLKRSHSKAFAFTLAEVAVTLVIVGFLASILIKNITAEVFKSEMRHKLTVAQSTLSEAITNTKKDNPGVSLYSVYTNYTGTYPYYLFASDMMQNFKAPLNKIPTYNTAVCYSVQKFAVGIQNIVNYPDMTRGAFVLQNGMIIMFSVNWSIPFITVDLNGPKPPNRLGFDVFVFQIDSRDQIMPVFKDDSGYTRFRCEPNGTGSENGYNCTKWALEDKCPDGSGRGYWECLPK